MNHFLNLFATPFLDYPYLKLDAVGQESVGAPAVEEEAVGVVEVLRVAVLARPLPTLAKVLPERLHTRCMQIRAYRSYP